MLYVLLTVGDQPRQSRDPSPYHKDSRFMRAIYLDKDGMVKRTVTFLTETPEFEEFAAGYKACMTCGSTKQLSKCSRCYGIYYCSKQCQHDDKDRHKWCCFPIDFQQDILHLTVSTLGYDHLQLYIPPIVVEGSRTLLISTKYAC